MLRVKSTTNLQKCSGSTGKQSTLKNTTVSLPLEQGDLGYTKLPLLITGLLAVILGLLNIVVRL